MGNFNKKWLHSALRVAGIAFVVLFLLRIMSLGSPTPAQQIEPLLITSPADGTIVTPGQTITVVVTPAPNIRLNGVFLIGRDPIGFTDPKLSPPFVFTITIPTTAGPGKYNLRAYGDSPSHQDLLKSPLINLVAEKSESITSLNVEPTIIEFGFAGAQTPLIVSGTFSDGQTFDLRESTKLSCTSQDSTVVKVERECRLTAVGTGNTNIVVSYGDKAMRVPVSVPRTIPGDLNGDGKVDQDDLNIILDALKTPAVGPFDARDLNKDGVIDILDAKQLVSLCTSRCNTINIPPDVTNARPSVATLWPPDHRMVPVSIVGVTDPDGDSVTIRVDGIGQDEPTMGLGDGDTCPDGAGVGTSTAQLRAERSGTGKGRVYTVYFTAQDSRGAESRGTVQVCVPHDQGGSCEFTGFRSRPVGDSTVCRP